MVKNKWLQVFLFIVCFGPNDLLKAQKSFDLNVLYLHHKMIDHQASPLIYRFNAPGVNALYENEDENKIFQIGGSFIFGNLNRLPATLKTDFEGSFLKPRTQFFSVSTKYLKKRSESFALGLAFDYDFWLDFESVSNWAWGVGQGSLNLTLLKSWAISDGIKLNLIPSISVLGLITRMPYSSIPRVPDQSPGVTSFFVKGTKLATLNRFNQFRFRLEARRNIEKKINPFIRSDFFWMRYTWPDEIRAFQLSVSLGLKFRLGK